MWDNGLSQVNEGHQSQRLLDWHKTLLAENPESMTQCPVKSIRPGAQTNKGTMKKATEKNPTNTASCISLPQYSRAGSLSSLWCTRVDLPHRKRARYLTALPPSAALTAAAAATSRGMEENELGSPACWEHRLWLCSTFVRVFLSQVKDASLKMQSSCDNTLSSLFSTTPFGAGKVNWGSNWLIGSLALGAASIQTQYGGTQPGAAGSCGAAPWPGTQPAPGRHGAAPVFPYRVCSPLERHQTRSRVGHRDEHLHQEAEAIYPSSSCFSKLTKEQASRLANKHWLVSPEVHCILLNPTNPSPIQFSLTGKKAWKCIYHTHSLPQGETRCLKKKKKKANFQDFS